MRASFSIKTKRAYIIAGVIIACFISLSVLLKPTSERSPMYMGQPIEQLLGNGTVNGIKHLNLDQMLTLKPLITGEEPSIATFELPISYDSLKSVGLVFLLVDAVNGSEPAGVGEYQECARATNGNCLLEWNITHDLPGAHKLQAELFIQGQKSKSDYQKFFGPFYPFYSSNACQFDGDTFDSHGAILHAKLFESNASYSIDIQSKIGTHIRTISGRITNGEINEFWDLTDDAGNLVSNMTEVNCVFYVTNSTSGEAKPGASVLHLSRSSKQ